MRAEHIPGYLANVLCVIQADGELSPSEERAFAEVCAESNAKKRQVKQAEKLVSESDFKPVPIGRYSEQIRNVEDMVLVAMADGDVSGPEKKRIASFALAVGVTKEQVNRILSECRSSVQARFEERACAQCGEKCGAEARFCPKCGAPLRKANGAPVKKLAFEYSSTGVAIEFAQSSAATFDAAVAAARNAEQFQQIERGGKAWFLASWPTGSVADSLKVATNLKSIRNRKVYVSGKELPWKEVFEFTWCMEQRVSAFRPVEYCFGADDRTPNLWGCKQIRMDWVEWAQWLRFGKFLNKQVYEFDKARIEHDLRANLYRWRFCPFIRPKLIEAVLRLLPSRVRVSEQHGWKYREGYEQTPHSIRIVQRVKEGGDTYTQEFYSDSVVPSGNLVARAILGRALEECAIGDVDLQAVFP